MSIPSGTRLGPYEIVGAIGAGGMGEVYKARDTRLDRTVAVKILPESLASDPQFRERFDREARAISQLTHPHICTLYDIGESVGTAFLVMEYLEGETLEQRLKKGALPLDEALKIAIQIADALRRVPGGRCCRPRRRISRRTEQYWAPSSTWLRSSWRARRPTSVRISSGSARSSTRY
jgi:serine/threonine protein kinase